MLRALRMLLVAGLVLGAAACQVSPGGTDGDLVDDWRPLAAPAFDVPAVGTCLESTARAAFDPRFYRATPIACDRQHALEVALVGTVEGDAAAAAAPPAAGSAAYQAAYAACGKATDAYVGGDWHDGLLGIDVQLPTKAPWTGGQRTYVCTVFGISSAYGVMAFRKGTLKDALAGTAPSAIRCLDVVGDKSKDGWYEHLSALTPIACTSPHNGEYAGTVEITGATRPADAKLRETQIGLCWAKTAAFLGLTKTQLNARKDIEVAWDSLGADKWNAGDHHNRCVVVVPYEHKVSTSLKNLGPSPLPA